MPRARGLVALAHSSCSLHAQSDADFSPHTLELHTENTALYWLTPESSDEILMKQAPLHTAATTRNLKQYFYCGAW